MIGGSRAHTILADPTGGMSVAGSGGSGGASAGAGGQSGGAGGSVAAGGGGAGGSGGAPACPPAGSPPTEGDNCTQVTPDSCFYPGLSCSCLPDGASAASRKWSCYGARHMCPDAAPVDNTSCKTFEGTPCPYAAHDYCVCPPGNPGGNGGPEPKWNCTTDPNPICPPTRPDMGAACLGVLRECVYGEGRECFCDGMTWTCE